MNASCNNRLLVIGDVMLDLYTRGVAERVSPEAPVLVLKAEREEARLGGAGAVATLLAALGARPIVAGLVGDDPAGHLVSRLLSDFGKGETGHREQGTKNRSSNLRFSIPSPPLPSGEGRGEGGQPLEVGLRSASRNRRGIVSLEDLSPTLTVCGRPTTVKERLIGQAAGRHGQQMLRVDRESCGPVPDEIEDSLRTAALAALDDAQAVLISDYGKGVCTAKLMAAVICAAHQRRLPVLVDPRRGGDYQLYRWATVIKPNRREAGEATGREIRCLAQAFAAGQDLCARFGFRAAVITLDADGLVLVTADGLQQHFITRDRQVADVTGAGDTVLAMLGIALSRGFDLPHACQLANAAAALQVERLGVSPISWAEVGASVGNALRGVPSAGAENEEESGEKGAEEHSVPAVARGQGSVASTGDCKLKIANCKLQIDSFLAPSEDLVSRIAAHRKRGQKIVFTNGCFDLLHAGHLHCLTQAKSLGDILVVALNSDTSVKRLKGTSRPVVGQLDRWAMLAALWCVDYVTIFDDDTPERLIAELRPDVLVKGAEARPGGISGESLVLSYGGCVEQVPLLPGISTTALLASASSVGNGLRAVPPASASREGESGERARGSALCEQWPVVRDQWPVNKPLAMPRPICNLQFAIPPLPSPQPLIPNSQLLTPDS